MFRKGFVFQLHVYIEFMHLAVYDNYILGTVIHW